MEQTLHFALEIDLKSAGFQRGIGFRNSGDGSSHFSLCEKVGLNMKPFFVQIRMSEKGWLKQAWKGQNLEQVGLNMLSRQSKALAKHHPSCQIRAAHS